MVYEYWGYLLSIVIYGWLAYYFGLRLSTSPLFFKIVSPGKVAAPLVKAATKGRPRNKKGTTGSSSGDNRDEEIGEPDLKKTQFKFVASFAVLIAYCAFAILLKK
jgi:hypothetical protein